jgi:hypothetical protein
MMKYFVHLLICASSLMIHSASSAGILQTAPYTFDLFLQSTDNSVQAGTRTDATGTIEAVRWTSATGFFTLGDLSGGTFFSNPISMSGDGNVIVGISDSGLGSVLGTASEAFVWTASTGMFGLGDFGGYGGSRARKVSLDGSTVIGTSFSGIDQLGRGFDLGFVWDAFDGIVNLGSGTTQDVSEDGRVVLGTQIDPMFPSFFKEGTYFWTRTDGQVDIATYVRSTLGINTGDMIIRDASFTTANGSFVKLTGFNAITFENETLFVQLPAPGTTMLLLTCGLFCSRKTRK